MNETKKPIAKVRFGAVSAAIWSNSGDSGPWYNVTISRTYRNKATDTLEDSNTFSGNDVLAAAEALRQAYLHIQGLRDFDRVNSPGPDSLAETA